MFTLSGFGDEISPVLGEQLDVMESEGIKHLEIRGINEKNIMELTDEEVQTVKTELDSRGFAISAIGSPIGKVKITDDFAEHLKVVERAIHLAGVFGTKYVRIFSYYPPEGGNIVDHRDEVMHRMKKKTELAAAKGIILLHENEHAIYGDIPERCKDMLDEVNSPNLRAIFDPANFVVDSVNPHDEAYPILEDYIEYMHIKDARTEGKDKTVVPAGEGEGHIKQTQ